MKRKKIMILPREPLTQKARAAIERYVILKGNQKGNYIFVLVKACLEAERMKRIDLYAWLISHGYTWNKGYWKEKSHSTESRINQP
jgi:hypothetical protein